MAVGNAFPDLYGSLYCMAGLSEHLAQPYKYKLGMSAPEFIGLKNYISLAGSSLFWKVMGNTLFLR